MVFRCAAGWDMDKLVNYSFLKRAFFLLPLLFICACTTTITPVGSMPIASSSLRAEKDTDQQHKLEAMKPAELIAEGQTQLAAGDFQLARIYFLKALDKTPTSAEAFVGLGEIWQKTGVPQKARMAYEKALEVKPDFIPALLAIGRLSREQGQLKEAENFLSRALALKPENVEVLTELALTYELSNPGPLAEPLFQKVVQLKPDSAPANNNLGYNYLIQERYPEAISSFQRALSLNPENKVALNNLASAYALNGEADKALEIFARSQGKAAAYNNLGYIYMSQKKFDLAEKAFKQALILKPRLYVRAQQNLDHLLYMQKAVQQ
jgi:Flp pilus assembly protein TadD